jgi:hypothetical protein
MRDLAAPTALPEADAPHTPEPGGCPRCGSAHGPLQEYCLECGQRLPVTPGVGASLATAWGRRTTWYAGDWVWPALAALVVAVLAAVAVVAVRVTDKESAEAFLTATEPAVAPPVTAAETARGSETAPEAGLRATLPELSETEPVPTQPAAAPRGQLAKWPPGTDGFTVVLASVPDGGRVSATQRAKQASAKGLPEVGVVSSSEYSSLHPGYLVVFSGVYATRSEAEAAIENARAKGYNDAYAAQVAR